MRRTTFFFAAPTVGAFGGSGRFSGRGGGGGGFEAEAPDSLRRVSHDGSPHCAHGYKMQFINPATGGPVMPTMAAFVQLLPARFSGVGYRATDGTVFHAIEGAGAVHIAGQAFSFSARDTFVVPAWTECRLQADRETVLFSFSDRPVQRAMGVWREELLAA